MSPERRKDIEALFEKAIEQPRDEQAAWLDAHCDDPELRAEVAGLLAAHERTGGILDESLHLPADEFTGGNAEDGAEGRVGPYRTVHLLGHGGMGSVYLAERADGQFDQRVALKLLRSGFDSEDRTRRFLAERQILASLDHPNIARLLDGGVTDEGQPFFVMEYVDGQPLDVYCDTRQHAIEQRLNLFLSVCGALQYAHRSLVVHRDLKPSNILVTDTGAVKLLDFGIAKLLSPDPSGLLGPEPHAILSHPAPRTRTGLLPMTPAYASPEQIRAEPITAASDIYQLGVVLYELLTGHRPYRLRGRTPSEMERIICEEEPTRPSTAITRAAAEGPETTPEHVSRARRTDPHRLQERLKGDLDTIVLKALRKEPNRRYDSAEQLADDLRRYLNDEPVTARESTPAYRMSKFVRRHRMSVVAAALVILSLLVGLAGTAWQAHRATEQAAAATLERDKAEQVTDFMMGLFEASDPSEALGDTITARQLLARGVDRAEELDGQPVVQAKMFDVVGRVYQHLGQYGDAQPLLERALDLRRRHLGTEHVEMAESMNSLASLLHDRGAYAEAEPLYREALAMRRRLLGTEHEDVAESMNNLALVLLRTGDYDEAASLYRESLAIKRRLLDDGSLQLVPGLSGLATVLQVQENYEAAEPLFREAVDISRRELDEQHPQVATTLNNLGLLLSRMDRHDEAERHLREALALRRDLLGEEHPRVATTLNNVASVLHLQGDHEAAEPLFRQSLAINRKLLGDDHPRVAAGMDNLGEVLVAKGEYAEAEPLLQEALRRLRTSLDDDHPYVERSAEHLAELYEAWGRPDDAAHYDTLIADSR